MCVRKPSDGRSEFSDLFFIPAKGRQANSLSEKGCLFTFCSFSSLSQNGGVSERERLDMIGMKRILFN